MNMFKEWRVPKLFFHIYVLSEMLVSQCIALLCLDTRHLLCILCSTFLLRKTKVKKSEGRNQSKKNQTHKNQNLISAEANNFRFLCSQHLIWFLIFWWGAFLRKRTYDSFESIVCIFYSSCIQKNKNKKSAPAQFSLLTLRLFREAVAKEQRDFIFYWLSKAVWLIRQIRNMWALATSQVNGSDSNWYKLL